MLGVPAARGKVGRAEDLAKDTMLRAFLWALRLFGRVPAPRPKPTTSKPPKPSSGRLSFAAADDVTVAVIAAQLPKKQRFVACGSRLYCYQTEMAAAYADWLTANFVGEWLADLDDGDWDTMISRLDMARERLEWLNKRFDGYCWKGS
jgi:hypothetical protein